jgi:hypothetical protein
MAQENNAQTSKTGQKNTNESSNHESVQSGYTSISEEFKSQIIKVDFTPELRVQDVDDELWNNLKGVSAKVRHQHKYMIQKYGGEYWCIHKAYSPLTLLRLPYSSMDVVASTPHERGYVQIVYLNGSIITTYGMQDTYIRAKSIEELIDTICYLRMTNHQNVEFHLIANEDLAVASFNKQRQFKETCPSFDQPNVLINNEL